ncbi:DNA ligase (NAD(+)) [Mycoplasmopsis columbina SF7]|uniref:DNA ligase n=1 Tax=Mycoplasmopsis columbina SF7 TaxID=1037410 RepID=F9UK22_9BACT|nr:NAD-dependent DNA ligase LigA [Mycoplasmopsis columbina]EGV00027.1 DNA ligase (NAD(+)) [Mycoplasmopsis columbina SF7]
MKQNNSQNFSIKEKINHLVEQINQWNKEYFLDNNPSVSDLIYDQTLLELEQLENTYPEFISPLSPTQNVGGFIDNKFTKVEHKYPMLSLNKAYSYDEILKFISNLEKIVPLEQIQFSLEPKIDGLSVALHYQNGYLVQALTRGDGSVGEDITENVKTIISIPKVIDLVDKIEIRGEVFLAKEKFEAINKDLKNKGEKEFANPRNAASGTLRQLNAQIVKDRELSAYLYEIVEPENYNLTTQYEVINYLKKLNFPTNELSKVVDVEELEDEIENFAEIKNKLPYDADGLVIKLNNLTYWSKLGKTAKFPKHSIAFKYEVEQAQSKILAISPTVGRTGKITYVAALEPVELNQTTVRNATLHNYNFIKSLNIDIGDKVNIIKAGEIIPKIISTVNLKNHTNYEKVLTCPSCNSILVEYEDNVDQFCTNKLCKEIVINSLYHFASRKSLNIVGLGLNTIKDLYEINLLKTIEDIFELEKHVEIMKNLPRYAELKVSNLITNINKSKITPFYKVLFAIGIKHLGERAAKLFSQEYNNFGEMLVDPLLTKMQNIPNIGPKILESVSEYLQDTTNHQLLYKLDKLMTYEIAKKIQISSLLNNLNFVITGKLTNSRNYYVDLIEKHGGKILSFVNKKTNYLIAGEDVGSKLTKAQELEVKIINEEEFNQLLNSLGEK